MTSSADLDQLHLSLRERWRPERVLGLIVELDPELGRSIPLGRNLNRLKSHTLMPEKFRAVVRPERQFRVAEKLFPGTPLPDFESPQQIMTYLSEIEGRVGLSGHDFQVGRLNRKDRLEEARLEGSPEWTGHRAYNKRFRFLVRLWTRMIRYGEIREVRHLAQVAKTRLALEIRREEISDPGTAFFVAYQTSLLGRRSIFTHKTQPSTFDSVSKFLFDRLGPDTNWLAVAMIHPDQEVLNRLGQQDLGNLLGRWHALMERAAHILKKISSGMDLHSMVVRSGMDSSTWNEVAGAFNKTREGWLNTVYAMGADSLLDSYLPGKVMRVMAADVAAMHQAYGKGEHSDVEIWRNLPHPWEVVAGTVTCSRSDIERVCPEENRPGWVGPRTQGEPAPFRPTPELAHGVALASPQLAWICRKINLFK